MVTATAAQREYLGMATFFSGIFESFMLALFNVQTPSSNCPRYSFPCAPARKKPLILFWC